MILEVEIKAPCEDFSETERFLEERGATFQEERLEVDEYYNHPARDFRHTDEALRIRTIGERALLTYKGPKLSSIAKSRLEHEVSLGDSLTTEKILLALGFVRAGTVEKRRRLFSLGDVEICFDEVPGLGTFVEFEKKSSDREKSEEELIALARECGLHAFENKSYLELLLSSPKGLSQKSPCGVDVPASGTERVLRGDEPITP